MHWKSKRIPYPERLLWRSLGRWWIAGLAFYAGGIAVLYLFIHTLRMKLWLGTSLSAEITLLLRFLTNDRWVFGYRYPTWRRLWQYQLASAGSAGVWWILCNVLPIFGIQYLVASTVGSICAAFFGMVTNFLWIWRRRVGCSSGINPPSTEPLPTDSRMPIPATQPYEYTIDRCPSAD